MEKNYTEYIGKFLNESSRMIPSPTHLKPFYRRDSSIKSIILDIYGTILISASGDIDESEITTENLKLSLDTAGITISNSVIDPEKLLLGMLESFKISIAHIHLTERSPDRPFPEIDILKIWETIIYDNRDKQYLKISGPLCIKCFTFVFEVLSNSIYPMPGMKEVIMKLSASGIPIGIISNAQFYTPVILNYFMHGEITEKEEVPPFDNDLTIFSYKYRRSKPDKFLFEIVKNTCKKKYNINADEILFLGNDIFRDIYPASLAGFKTALFAGDSKSLRLRKENPEMVNVTPDYIITELLQLLKVVS